MPRQAVKPPVSPRAKPWQALPAGEVRRACGAACLRQYLMPRWCRGYEYRCAAAGLRYFCSGDNPCVAVAVGNSGHTDGVLADIAVLPVFLPVVFACGRLP